MTDPYARIGDPEVRELAAYAQLIRADYESDEPDPWQDSPFGWIRTHPSRTVGAIGEKLVAAWCAANGFNVVRSPDSEADRVIEGHRFEIKFSTVWQTGIYKFQQIRDQDYDFLFALGISPFNAHAWILPKSVLSTRPSGLRRQHGGARGRDTDWLRVTVGHEHEWMSPYGGTLAAAREFLVGLGEDRST